MFQAGAIAELGRYVPTVNAILRARPGLNDASAEVKAGALRFLTVLAKDKPSMQCLSTAQAAIEDLHWKSPEAIRQWILLLRANAEPEDNLVSENIIYD